MSFATAGSARRLVLASGSPRRQQLLRELGLEIDVMPADVTEWEEADADPASLVAHNAGLKAHWVAERFPDAPVLAADTTVALDARVMNKPADLDEARAMLRTLSGRTHVVHTGVQLLWNICGDRMSFVETSEVSFKQLDESTIGAYLARVNVLDKAGAYGIQEGRELIVDSWTGSLHNIMGLPTERLKTTFEQLGWWPDLRRVVSTP